MGLLPDWFETASSVIRSPSKTLQSESRDDGFGYPLKFMLTSVFMAGILNTAAMALRGFTTLQSVSSVDLILYFIGSVLGGPVVLAGLAAFVHVFAYLFGARRGYRRTFAAIGYGTAVTPLAAVFTIISVFFSPASLISLLLGLWALQIQARGVQHFHELSDFKATVAVLMPIILVVLGVLVATMMAFGSMLLM